MWNSVPEDLGQLWMEVPKDDICKMQDVELTLLFSLFLAIPILEFLLADLEFWILLNVLKLSLNVTFNLLVIVLLIAMYWNM